MVAIRDVAICLLAAASLCSVSSGADSLEMAAASAGGRTCTAAASRARSWGSVETVFTGPFSALRVWLKSDGTFPNNDAYPLLVYQRVLTGADASQSKGAALLTQNGWTSPWAWGVFSYHHYHSTAWEALLCVQGEAEIQFGGPKGPTLHTDVRLSLSLSLCLSVSLSVSVSLSLSLSL